VGMDRSSLRWGEYGVNWDSPQAKGLVGWWPECQFDIVGGHHARPTGSPVQRPSIMGPALSLNNTFNYRSVAHHSDLINVNNLTISMWVFPRTTANGRDPFSKRTNANTGFLTVEYTGTTGGFNFYFDQHNSGYQAGTDDVSGTMVLVRWNHLAFTWDVNDAARLYVNGVQVDSQAAAGALNTNTADIVFGADPAFGRVSDVMLRDIRIYRVTCNSRTVAGMFKPDSRYDLYLPHGRRTWFVPPATGNRRRRVLLGAS